MKYLKNHSRPLSGPVREYEKEIWKHVKKLISKATAYLNSSSYIVQVDQERVVSVYRIDFVEGDFGISWQRNTKQYLWTETLPFLKIISFFVILHNYF